jgi:hypothetical protein
MAKSKHKTDLSKQAQEFLCRFLELSILLWNRPVEDLQWIHIVKAMVAFHEYCRKEGL